jgi:Skp family chaperone for outer membrane proteins
VQVSFRKLILGSLAAVAFAVPAMAEIKIGVVDYARLFEESPQAKVVRDALQTEFGRACSSSSPRRPRSSSAAKSCRRTSSP